jgi:thiamine transport system substrate-binding protein
LQVDAAESRPVVTLMTHDSFAVSKDLLKTFEEKHGVTLKILKGGDAGAALNQAILSKANPLADVFFGVDNTFMSRALAADIFVAYASPKLADIPDALKLDPRSGQTRVQKPDRCPEPGDLISRAGLFAVDHRQVRRTGRL